MKRERIHKSTAWACTGEDISPCSSDNGGEGGVWFIRVVGVHVCLTEFSSYLGVFPDIFMLLASSLVL